ncbi:MAG: methyltransferase domain-containing protein [Owenweeksia sp.]|nr:methyltransferase domain-containing protein [Owenweeksia sp.]
MTPSTTEMIDGFSLGFKKRGQRLAGVKLQGDSGLFDEQLEDALPQISEFFQSRELTAWHARKRQGFCRFLTIKKSFSQDGLLINFTSSSSQVNDFDQNAFKDLMIRILGDRLLGLVHTINDDPGDRPITSEGEQQLLHGSDHIFEEVCGLRFRISLESFFQTNPSSAEKLYQKAMDYVFASTGSKPVVMDLFSGTGTISQMLAQRSENKEVVGVELLPEAVEDARENARLNGFTDIQFFAADVGHFILNHPQYKDQIDTIVLDPPRAGIAPKTLRKVMRLEALTHSLYLL